MIAVLSVASLAGGLFLTCYAQKLSRVPERVEMYGGLLLILGLVLIGIGLPISR